MKTAIAFLCFVSLTTAGSLFGHSSFQPPAPLNYDGTVAETPEVQAAKAQHLAAHAEASARASHSQPEEWDYSQMMYAQEAPYTPVHGSMPMQQSYTAQHEPAPLNPDGTVAETPEVQSAKAQHLAAHAVAKAQAQQSSHDGWDFGHDYQPAPQNYGWQYSQAQNYQPPAPLNHDGTVAETPEVQALKAQHLAAHAEARAKASYQQDMSEYDGPYNKW